MAQDKSTDILMKFVLMSGKPIAAECSTEFDSKALLSARDMLEGFTIGNFFEIEEVELGFTKPKPGSQGVAPTPDAAATEMGEIDVSRRIDQASPVLMDCCFNAKPLASASIVKRRSAGANVSGDPYLRIDFTGVLITKVGWNDAEVVKEKISFVSRGVTIMYRQQLASGKMGPISSASWKLFK